MVNAVPRRRRFTAVRRRGAPAAQVENIPADVLPVAAPSWSQLWHGTAGLQQIAQLLWLPSYDELFELEFEVNSAACGGGGFALPPSTYRQRLRGESAQRYDHRRRMQTRDQMAIELHANNMRRWSPSLLARSVSYFTRTSEFTHLEESRQRRMASQPVTLAFLRTMRNCRFACHALRVHASLLSGVSVCGLAQAHVEMATRPACLRLRLRPDL